MLRASVWRRLLPSVCLVGLLGVGLAWAGQGGPFPITADPFRQLDELLPTPTSTRTGSGAPGHEYWQQQADYRIEVEIDDDKQHLHGKERVVYTNNSPDTLRYLWLQLDPNIYAPMSDRALTATTPGFDRVPYRSFERMLEAEKFDGSVKLAKVVDKRGRALNYAVVGTMMRIDLPKPLPSGRRTTFEVEWSYAINDSDKVGGRTGFERFDDGNIIYEIAQWFPRMAPYDDVNGWQHKQYLGRGEFALEFGDYQVEITVPADHVVAATGVLQNERQVLTKSQRQRLDQARQSKKQTFIVTPEEAAKAEKGKPRGKKTWKFKADNVRDFAFATSRKFIWDAQAHEVDGNRVLAMSYYPNEGEPLWSKYSTKAIIHTLNVYSRYTFNYPYPVAISVNGPVGGMEYPMICFNGPRPEDDGTYSKRTKYGLISVIIHEVGHNYFPMIVNSDERRWTWMDEGLNTFLQFRAEQEWERDYPSRRGEPSQIVDYMRGDSQTPIMTHSDSVLQLHNNAYAKTATALNVLRETVMGRELFDHAFKEYARRWKFRRPKPADFFRTMEDASGVDLDWFWRGWFYTTDHVDIAVTGLREFVLDTKDPKVEKARQRRERDAQPPSMTKIRDRDLPRFIEQHEDLKDFYNEYDPLDVTDRDRQRFEEYVEGLDPKERALLGTSKRFFVIDLKNVGGIPMPVIVDIGFADGTRKELRIPAEIWRRNRKQVSKLILADKDIVTIKLDPHLETADTDVSNNEWPPQPEETRFELFKRQRKMSNPMREAGLGAKEGGAKSDVNERGAKVQGAGKSGVKDKNAGKPSAKVGKTRRGEAKP